MFSALLSKLGPNISSWFPYLDIEIRSDTSLAEAVQTLSKFKVLSAPVVDVDAPEDASWIDRYIGIVEFPGIVVWLLHQVSVLSNLLFRTSGFFISLMRSPRKYERRPVSPDQLDCGTE